MFKFSVILIICFLSGHLLHSQGIQDTVVQLEGVEIKADNVFRKENAGMAVTKVDSLILAEKLNLGLSELLSQNTPVFIKDYGRGALATASFRGTAASHTNVTWNGIVINSPMTGMVDFSLIPVHIIDDLELRAGPASITDRGGGLGGSVNINNKVDWKEKLGIRVVQGIGSYNTFNEFLQLSMGNQKIHSKTRAYYNYSDNDYTFINRGIVNVDPVTGEVSNPPDTNKNANYTQYGILQEFFLRIKDANTLSVKYWYQHAARTIPRATSYEGPDNSNLNRHKVDDHKVIAEWKRFGTNSSLVVRSGFIHQNLLYTLKNNVPGLGKVPAIYSSSKVNSLLNKVSYKYSFQHDIKIEASLDADWSRVSSLDSVTRTGYEKERNEMSAMVSVQKSFADRLNLKLLIRQDWIDLKFMPVVPYFGFDFRIIRDKDLFLKGNIARNFHYPSLNDLYWQPGGNPDLLPEKGYSFELGLDFTQKLGRLNLETGVNAFRSDIDQWIIWLPGFKGYWEPRNVDRVISRGVEISLNAQGEIGRLGYRVFGNYSYTQSLNYGQPLVWGDESYGKQLPYIPLHSGNLLVNLSYHGFYISYQHNSYSERYTTSSNDLSGRGSIYPYFMNDLGAGKEFRWKTVNLTAEFKVYNLFNETYHTVLYRPMPGRNYMFVLMVDWNKR